MKTGGESSKFVAMNLQHGNSKSTKPWPFCDLVQGHKRSPKQIWLRLMNGTCGTAPAAATPSAAMAKKRRTF